MDRVTEESMTKTDWMAEVEKRAAAVAEREGCLLYDLEMVGLGAGRTLRVYIDKEENIGIEDCSNVSRGLNEVLDDGDIVPGGPYMLEVSTPGVDRHLKRLWHFEKVVGKKIWVRLKSALETLGVDDKKWKTAKTLELPLNEVKDQQLSFTLDFQGEPKEVLVPLEAVEKAKLTFEIIKNDKNKNSHGNRPAKKRS